VTRRRLGFEDLFLRHFLLEQGHIDSARFRRRGAGRAPQQHHRQQGYMDEHHNGQRMALACAPPLRIWGSVGLAGAGFLLCRAHAFPKMMLFKSIEI